MRVTTIRHGETEWNVARRIQGSQDIELNQMGLSQAECLAVRLAEEPCDIIYSSDLLRARKTAEIINSRHNAELITTPYLREASFGKFEGLYIDDIKQQAAFGEYMDRYIPLFFAKVNEYLEVILRGGHENIFIVAHHVTIQAVICYLLGLSTRQRMHYPIGNTGIHTFEKEGDGEFVLVLENDTAHLDGLKQVVSSV